MNTTSSSQENLLPIGKVAKIVGVETHTIRYWDGFFDHINCHVGKGDRRYYDQKAIEEFGKIKQMMHSGKYTLEGVKSFLTTNRHSFVSSETEDSAKMTLTFKNQSADKTQQILDIKTEVLLLISELKKII